MFKKIFSFLIIFFISLTILAFEILFIKIFSITGWQNYASIIISIALLGFGISGTIISIFKKYLLKDIRITLITSLILFIMSLLLSVILYSIIPFNPFEIGWDNIQILYLLLHFAVLVFPFICAGFIIGIFFLVENNIPVVYFSNLLGSGIGTVIVLLLLFLFHPLTSLMIVLWTVSIFSCIYIIFCFFNNIKTYIIITVLFILLLLPLSFNLILIKKNIFKISEYKGISYSLKLPNAKIIISKKSPLGLVQIVEAGGLRIINSLSYNFFGEIPVQRVIYIDGDNPSVINPFNGNFSKIDFIKYTSSCLPYELLKDQDKKNVLIIGTGGGEGILRALSYNAGSITGIEINKNIIDLMKNEMSDFSGNIYNYKNVNIINSEARGFIRGTDKKFDIIELSLLDSFISASSGILSLNENYLYTSESIKEMYDKLSDKGILSITRWIKEPPRDILKLFAASINMMKKNNVKEYQKKIAVIRSANTATLCLSKNNINIRHLKEFYNNMSFDPVYFFNINKDDVNKNIKLITPYYYEGCIGLFDDYDNFINNYPFNIKPAADDSPYYNNFFKLKTINIILKTGTRQIQFTEWGFLIFIILLILIGFLSFIFIILPLLFIKKSTDDRQLSNIDLYIFLYFFIIGIAFFFVEMSLIQKFILYLSDPIYSISIIITVILIFSGLGSYYSAKIKIGYFKVFFIIGLFVILYLIFLDSFFYITLRFNNIIKIIITILLLSFPAFFMGIPFPAVMSLIKGKSDFLVAWSWGISGFASVVSIITASILAMIFGFKIVLLMAAMFYFLSGLIYNKIKKRA